MVLNNLESKVNNAKPTLFGKFANRVKQSGNWLYSTIYRPKTSESTEIEASNETKIESSEEPKSIYKPRFRIWKGAERTKKEDFTNLLETKYKLSGDKLEKMLEVVESQYYSNDKKKSRETILSEEVQYTREYREFIKTLKERKASSEEVEIYDKVRLEFEQNKDKKSVARLYHEVSERVYKEKERKENEKEIRDFEKEIKRKYRIGEEKLAKLSEVIDYEYHLSDGKKSREKIMKEEEYYSKDYKQFLDYFKKNRDNFVAEAIIEKVHDIYNKNNGKKSVARIFRELKIDEIFNTGLRHNQTSNRYESYVNDKSKDVRDLKTFIESRNNSIVKYNSSLEKYLSGETGSFQKFCIDRETFMELDDKTKKYVQDIENLGLNSSYKGVDRSLKRMYELNDERSSRSSDYLVYLTLVNQK